MKNLLIISTNQILIELITKSLMDKAMVASAESSSIGLRQHENKFFDMLFLDIDGVFKTFSNEAFTNELEAFRKTNPQIQTVVISSNENIRNAVQAVRNGADDYLTYPIDEKEVLLVFQSFQSEAAKSLELDYLRGQFWKSDWLDVISTQNSVMQRLYGEIRAVAPTIANVLLLGETGTGKGLLARLIHWHSLRSEKPFIVVHCGAIPDTLIESELFGHERGAFTGADRRKLGKFEMAQGGTIFLDEIGTITAMAQVKLLQVLQDGTYSRVGGTNTLQSNARIIAATNDDLKELVEMGGFRSDLYYRLNVFPLNVPPLRERIEDLPRLIDVSLQKLNDRYGKGIPKLHVTVMAGMKEYGWPGNIRELENVLERAYILEQNDELSPLSFPIELVIDKPVPKLSDNQEDMSLSQARHIAMEQCEHNYLTGLLKRFKGKISLSAQHAQITPRQLNRLMSRHHLNKNDFK